MSLEELMGHMEPSDTDLRALQAASAQQLQEAVQKIGVVVLSAKAEVKT